MRDVLETNSIGAQPQTMHREIFGVARIHAGRVDRDSDDLAFVDQIFGRFSRESGKSQVLDIAKFIGSQIALFVWPITAPSRPRDDYCSVGDAPVSRFPSLNVLEIQLRIGVRGGPC